ncbi:hypothetical protein EYF80_016397 [Liparis tanakae]|uniref:Uncharacterized protein n=1 Tax=Liparis tanakae TaxID=230148 RepID=A0A4Z2I8K9_9TELE|nr:hypothetical protein EYF80_016397 [Liparis tanakae]
MASVAVILRVARCSQQKGKEVFITVTDALFVHVQRRHPCAVTVGCILLRVQPAHTPASRGQWKRHELARLSPELTSLRIWPKRISGRTGSHAYEMNEQVEEENMRSGSLLGSIRTKQIPGRACDAKKMVHVVNTARGADCVFLPDRSRRLHL